MNEKVILGQKQKLRQNMASLVVLGIFLPAILMTLSIGDLQADSINPGVYSIDEKPYGLAYSNWTENFWKWMISIPQQNNPNLDPTGEKCMINQTDPNVWYLAPTFGGAAERTCVIPEGKAILFSLLVGECNYLENPELKTESELLSCAREGQDQPRTMAAAVDGTKLKDLEKYRVDSQLFDLTFPENNVYSVTPGKTKAVSDGFWVFLKPLPAGNHDIDFSASTIDPSGVNNYNTQVKYHLIVKPTNSTATS
jgi:hypothetical protein